MKTILREDESGVSEVIGTILILGITVTLFSVIIVWVSGVPAPVAQTRVDITSSMVALTPSGTGVNITLTHSGGESLYPVPTVIYVTDQVGSTQTTDTVTLHLFTAKLINPNGLLDGTDSIWSIGERWNYENAKWSTSDSITVTVVDNSKGNVMWMGQMNPTAGARPPIFLNVWAAGFASGVQTSTLYAGNGMELFANVISPSGQIKSVYANFTAWQGYTTSGCNVAFPMLDNGQGADAVPNDNIYSFGLNYCVNAPYPLMTWDQTYVLLNATDMQGHTTTTRFQLHVSPSPTIIANLQTIPSQLWQYIGFVQIRTGQVWLSNQTLPYNTANTFTPFEVQRSTLNSPGAIFHFKMANHGNTTIFIDGYTEAFFTNTQSPGQSKVMFIVAPCSTSINANAGGITGYPGSLSLNTFAYATYGTGGNVPGCNANNQPGVFDINPTNQEMGGTPYTVMAFASSPFGSPSGPNWPAPGSLGMTTYFIQILVAGMSGPVNYTYSMLMGQGGNPLGCGGLGPNYNPLSHLNDPVAPCRTNWYAQVVPFNAMIMFG